MREVSEPWTGGWAGNSTLGWGLGFPPWAGIFPLGWGWAGICVRGPWSPWLGPELLVSPQAVRA